MTAPLVWTICLSCVNTQIEEGALYLGRVQFASEEEALACLEQIERDENSSYICQLRCDGWADASTGLSGIEHPPIHVSEKAIESLLGEPLYPKIIQWKRKYKVQKFIEKNGLPIISILTIIGLAALGASENVIDIFLKILEVIWHPLTSWR
ncbi:hypothetical protein [Thauera sp. 2A1]|uniref:hypothetical protein n=1 Tax=Thauera sp. 2A1 TaxID=2570191 RepID=UPI001290EEA6|nr:hypothetical protein [Thauera sp. 2A1]KAI5912162.1 hypothetical protein GH664_22975 [Thauera sp. 2A1]KAI5914987.1 hypothetical protein GH664_09230 [Thauera sp. 2A1]